MTRPKLFRWRTLSRALLALIPLSVPALAVVLFAGQANGLPTGNIPAGDELRVLDSAAFSRIAKGQTVVQPSAKTDDVPEVEVSNWENTQVSTSGHKF